MVKLVFIVGSLRKGSFNEQLAKKVESLLPKHVDVSYLSVDLPLMNQDLETPVLPEIQSIRDQVMAADALWIFTPAYNHAIPGSLKNALDWLSRSLDLSDLRGPSALQDKFVTASCVANGQSPEDVFEQLIPLLNWLRTRVVEPFTGVPINPEAWGDNKLVVSDNVVNQLETQIKNLLAAISADDK